MKELLDEYGGMAVIFVTGLGFIIGLSFITTVLQGEGGVLVQAIHDHWSRIF